MARVKERIQKVLANAGVASRRAVEEMIQQGRISVNGRVVTTLPVLIDPDKDKVRVDDEAIKLATDTGGRRTYILMNKPKGVYTTNVAQGAQVRAIDLLGPGFPARVYPVGRLDSEATGLILLTNDGELTNQLTHPRYGVPKTYRAIVDGRVEEASVKELEEGVWISDKTGRGVKTSPARIKVVKRLRDRSVLELSLREGRNAYVRRMLARVGHKVRELVRIKMGPLELDRLGPGEFRELTHRELRELNEYMARRQAKAAEAPPTSRRPTSRPRPAPRRANKPSAPPYHPGPKKPPRPATRKRFPGPRGG